MQVRQALEAERLYLFDTAGNLVRRYWDTVRANKQSYSGWNSYGVRVRWRKTTISIEWFLNVMTGLPSHRQHRAFYVKRGKGYTYRMSSFPKAKTEWEWKAIAEFEAAAGPLRQRAHFLAEISKLVAKYESLAEPAAKQREDSTMEFHGR